MLDLDEGRAAAIVSLLNEYQHHRGPDDAALVRAKPFTLGNTRLAVQDPSPAGNQPFISHDGRYVCVFNGEIYNFVELIERYSLDVPNRCDGSVIPELWALLGPDLFAQLRGMYAVAVVDSLTGTLSLARDPFGIKPLYLRRFLSGTLAFASEARALANLSPFAPVSQEAVARYLHLGAMPADVSPFEGVQAVAPNSILTVSSTGVVSSQPVLAGDHPLVDPEAGPKAGLGIVFRESIDLHLRADVPTVLLLSSGVDSTAIASAARSLGHDLHCMTVRMPGSQDESEQASRSAQHYGHTHEVVDPRLDPAAIEKFFTAMQRPSIDGLNTFLVTSAVHEAGYRVALSGLGGDEALGGYRHYRLLRWLRLLRLLDRVPQAGGFLLRAARIGRVQMNSDKMARLVGAGGPRTAASLDLLQREVLSSKRVYAATGIDPDSLAANGREGESCSFAALVEAELRNYMQPMLLADADGFSMCWSVELRVPFVDTVLFRAATAAVAARKQPGKAALIQELGDPYLLDAARQAKRGFSLPMAGWLHEGPLRPLVDALGDSDAPVWEFVSRAEAQRAVSSPDRRWVEQWLFVALNTWLLSLAQERLALARARNEPPA